MVKFYLQYNAEYSWSLLFIKLTFVIRYRSTFTQKVTFVKELIAKQCSVNLWNNNALISFYVHFLNSGIEYHICTQGKKRVNTLKYGWKTVKIQATYVYVFWTFLPILPKILYSQPCKESPQKLDISHPLSFSLELSWGQDFFHTFCTQYKRIIADEAKLSKHCNNLCCAPDPVSQ